MNVLKPFGTESFVLGIGIAAISYLFGPVIKRGAKGVAIRGMQGALIAGDAANDAMESGSEKFSDFFRNIVNDGKDKSMDIKNDFHKDLIDEIRADRQQYSELMKELVSSVKNLQDDVKNLNQTTVTATNTSKPSTTN